MTAIQCPWFYLWLLMLCGFVLALWAARRWKEDHDLWRTWYLHEHPDIAKWRREHGL